jgi:ABC-type Mn2+/Zn2+ transport system ATPase subunit
MAPRPQGTITLDGVSVELGGRPVLDRIGATIAAGSAAAVIGPNGSGKTTLLNTIVGLVEPFEGQVDAGPPSSVAYVLQHHAGRAWLPLTAREVVTMGRYRHRGMLGRLRRADRAVIAEAATRLEIGDLLDRQYDELSGGQQQRVLLARALAQEPAALLLDEPITGLDLASQQRILDLIDEETTAGTTVVITTHNLDEARHCDTVLLLDRRLVAIGRPDDVLTPERLREAFGERVLGDHRDHDHASDLLLFDDPGHHHS